MSTRSLRGERGRYTAYRYMLFIIDKVVPYILDQSRPFLERKARATSWCLYMQDTRLKDCFSWDDEKFRELAKILTEHARMIADTIIPISLRGVKIDFEKLKKEIEL